MRQVHCMLVLLFGAAYAPFIRRSWPAERKGSLLPETITMFMLQNVDEPVWNIASRPLCLLIAIAAVFIFEDDVVVYRYSASRALAIPLVSVLTARMMYTTVLHRTS